MMTTRTGPKEHAAGEVRSFYLDGLTPPNSNAQASTSAETPMDLKFSHNGSNQVTFSVTAPAERVAQVVARVESRVVGGETNTSAYPRPFQVKRKLEMDGACPGGRTRRRITSSCSSEEISKQGERKSEVSKV